MAVSFHPTPRRILVRGVNWLGDAVMTTPALIRLREKFTGDCITLLTPEKLRELWTPHPAVDEVISFAAGDGVWSVGRKLRAGKFDLALVLPNSPRSALETWLAGIPQRVGYSRPLRNIFLTRAIPARAGQVKMRKLTSAQIKKRIASKPDHATGFTAKAATAHQLHEYLHLVAKLGASLEPTPPNLIVTPADEETVVRKFRLTKTLNEARPIFGLNPGAEYGPAKRWPVERFISAAREIQRQTNCFWVIFGGKSDLLLAEQIRSALPTASKQGESGSAQHPALNLAGQTSLRELMALLKLCRVLLTNDTGPMHVAAALGTPVVVPFGSTSPELTGPGLPGDRRHDFLKSGAPCSPCFRRECPIDFRCMNDISSERVMQALLQAISGHDGD
jgi:lipopolysaccharide heptosyltransferase II